MDRLQTLRRLQLAQSLETTAHVLPGHFQWTEAQVNLEPAALDSDLRLHELRDVPACIFDDAAHPIRVLAADFPLYTVPTSRTVETPARLASEFLGT